MVDNLLLAVDACKKAGGSLPFFDTKKRADYFAQFISDVITLNI